MTEIQSGQQHGDNAGQKDSIEGASPANRGDPDSHCSNISKVQDVGAQQDTEYPAGKGERRCIGRLSYTCTKANRLMPWWWAMKVCTTA